MMSLIKDFELKIKNSNSIDDVAALALVNKELSEGFKKEDLWNKALNQGANDSSLTELIYIKLRIKELVKNTREKLDDISKKERLQKAEQKEIQKLQAKREKEHLKKNEQDKFAAQIKQAISFLQNTGYSIRKDPIGKSSYQYYIEKDDDIFKPKSLEDIIDFSIKNGNKINAL